MNYVYKKVDKIVFSISSPKDIKRSAVAKIVTPEIYDKEGYPVDGGLMDIRLGVIDPGLRCKTCGEKIKQCIGHFGYIDLARPIIHIKYVKIIYDVLRSICRECNRVLLPEKNIGEHIEKLKMGKTGKDIELMRKISNSISKSARNVKKCQHCNAKQYKIGLEKPTMFTENYKKISPIEIRARFEKVSDDDLLLLGFDPESARPEWLIMIVLPIPPVTMRPSITLESGERSEDDLTHKLGDIVRINQRLFENINAGAPEVIIDDLWDLLQYHITTYFDNTITQIPPARHRSGQPLRTLTERIKSKEGRFRYNLAGKRVNFSARTVISPDSKLNFNEVGVPKEVAMILTIPERVVEWNLERLKKFVERGPMNYPGSNYVIRPDGRKKKITNETREQLLEELQPGYIVERHLMDGDISIFNRQPSLHRMSIMCHKVKVIPGKSFKMNPSVCFPFNADFDGDEMNLHIPQTEEARAEAEILTQVQTQITSPKHGLNVLGCVEDGVSGNYLLTRDMELSKEEAVQMLISVGVYNNDAFRKFKMRVTGKEIFSSLLPKNFSFRGQSKNKGEVIIENGVLIKGVIDDNSIGVESGSLLREYNKIYGDDETLDFMGKVFRLGIGTLLSRGFTTGISDLDLDEEVVRKVNAILQGARKETEQLIEDYHKGKIEIIPSKTVEESLEIHILQILNNVRNRVGKTILESVSGENSILIMANSGARGNVLNLAMMSAVVGQQALRGKRIENGYENRTLSVFNQNDLSPEARGFITNSFKKGLNPVEFFFGAMTGRDSLMDTALRTPKSGYLYRRLSNSLQDLKIEYDYTVRDSSNTIIQFKYGEDNIDVSKSDGGTIDVKNLIKQVVGKSA